MHTLRLDLIFVTYLFNMWIFIITHSNIGINAVNYQTLFLVFIAELHFSVYSLHKGTHLFFLVTKLYSSKVIIIIIIIIIITIIIITYISQ